MKDNEIFRFFFLCFFSFSFWSKKTIVAKSFCTHSKIYSYIYTTHITRGREREREREIKGLFLTGYSFYEYFFFHYFIIIVVIESYSSVHKGVSLFPNGLFCTNEFTLKCDGRNLGVSENKN